MRIKMDGKALADKICLDLKARCDVLKSRNINPVLTIVTSGEDSFNDQSRSRSRISN